MFDQVHMLRFERPTLDFYFSWLCEVNMEGLILEVVTLPLVLPFNYSVMETRWNLGFTKSSSR